MRPYNSKLAGNNVVTVNIGPLKEKFWVLVVNALPLLGTSTLSQTPPPTTRGTDASGDVQQTYVYVGHEWTVCFIIGVQGLFHDHLAMRMEICRCPMQNEHGAFLSSLVQVLVVDLFSSNYQCFGEGRYPLDSKCRR
jgi:hypothetical protein